MTHSALFYRLPLYIVRSLDIRTELTIDTIRLAFLNNHNHNHNHKPRLCVRGTYIYLLPDANAFPEWPHIVLMKHRTRPALSSLQKIYSRITNHGGIASDPGVMLSLLCLLLLHAGLSLGGNGKPSWDEQTLQQQAGQRISCPMFGRVARVARVECVDLHPRPTRGLHFLGSTFSLSPS
jgi:hypothetical protein